MCFSSPSSLVLGKGRRGNPFLRSANLSLFFFRQLFTPMGHGPVLWRRNLPKGDSRDTRDSSVCNLSNARAACIVYCIGACNIYSGRGIMQSPGTLYAPLFCDIDPLSISICTGQLSDRVLIYLLGGKQMTDHPSCTFTNTAVAGVRAIFLVEIFSLSTLLPSSLVYSLLAS